VQAGQTFSGWADWPQDGRDYIDELFDIADLIGGGRAAFGHLFNSLQQTALPPGAVVEIELAVRRRSAVIPA
jgi:hypothetical protein